ncbi:MAG TPA: ADOP family duplicated permease [Gemmatimonadales bacterium]|nr:ADOP family duplicated permease [Gemmatimonadales bacterium]
MRLRSHGRDLAEELAFHREAIERDLVARGHAPAEARDMARRAMGNETMAREDARGIWLWPRLEALWQDAKVTLRGLRRNPAFTVGVMLTFALGVGANAAMFSLLDRMMLRPPALMRDPASVHRVYLFRHIDGVEGETGGQYARHADLVNGTTSFSALAAHATRQLAVGVGTDAREMRIGVVSASFFDFFDAPPAAGRYFGAAEDAPPAGAPVAVLSHAMWQARFGGRQDAIGARLQIGAVVYTVIGVAPKEFVGLWPLRPPAAFIPVSTYAASLIGATWATTYSSAFGLGTIVRRKPGVSIAVATADLARAFVQSYRAQSAAGGRAIELAELRPRALAGSILLERGPGRSDVAKVATWLGGVSLIVLLIACANVASLLLARALSKRREIAVRLALGVSRSRLLSQILTESMVLALAGSVVGIVLAIWLSSLLQAAFLPGTQPVSVASDGRTLAFIGIVTLAVGAVTGLFPVLQARRLTLTEDLKSGARTGTYHRSRTRSALLVLQGALSLVLLVGAGLFVRSLRHVRDVRLGFDADSVLTVDTHMRETKLDSAQTAALRLRLLDAATTVPGIEHATLVVAEPFGGMSSWPIWVAGVDSVSKFGRFEFNSVSPDYFATMGTHLLRGRGIKSGDVHGAPRVMVVGASMAGVLWPGADPLGKCVRVGLVDTVPCTYVVGVAEDIHARGFGPQDRSFYYYLAAAQFRPQLGGLFVRAGGGARRFIEPLRRRLQQEMPGASYVTVSRLGELVENESRSWVMGATLFTAFGVLALILAAVGLYSVIAYNVAQRRQELAVRVALGAAASDLIRLVVGEGLRLASVGAAVGGVIALIVSPRVAPLLFNQSPRDPVVFGTVTGALLAVAIGASMLPAIRSAHVDPNSALRAE